LALTGKLAATQNSRIVGIWKVRAEREFGDKFGWREYYKDHPWSHPAVPREVAGAIAYVAVGPGQLHFRHRHLHGRDDRQPGNGV